MSPTSHPALFVFLVNSTLFFLHILCWEGRTHYSLSWPLFWVVARQPASPGVPLPCIWKCLFGTRSKKRPLLQKSEPALQMVLQRCFLLSPWNGPSLGIRTAHCTGIWGPIEVSLTPVHSTSTMGNPVARARTQQEPVAAPKLHASPVPTQISLGSRWPASSWYGSRVIRTTGLNYLLSRELTRNAFAARANRSMDRLLLLPCRLPCAGRSITLVTNWPWCADVVFILYTSWWQENLNAKYIIRLDLNSMIKNLLTRFHKIDACILVVAD